MLQYIHKNRGIFLCIAALLLVSAYILQQFGPAINNQINRLGKDQYYVRILEEGREMDTHNVQRKFYQYQVTAYNKQGHTKLLSFGADKKLKHYAWLRLYVKKNNEVTAWEEVNYEVLPDQFPSIT